LAAGAVWILIVERRGTSVRTRSLDELRWRQALGVGLFQCLALWPGVSRSGATILGGMTLGLDRKTATQYSFFAAVPVLCAAAAADLLKSYQDLQANHILLMAIGLVVSFVAAFAAVKLLLRYVASHTLTVFAWYRLGLAAVIAVTLW
jgi:undecaprenyl-diphosphatase